MALEGNLKDFALSEILQLISVQQKSGYLNLKKPDDSAEIWFDNGRITYATRAQEPLNEQIKQHLIKTKKLNQDIIDRVETAAAQSKVSFEKVLVNSGYLSGKELTDISAFLIEEMIHGLFNWQEGRYSFDADKKRSSTPADVSLKTEGLLMEGMRRIDEWPSILEKLPSGKIIVRQGEVDPEEFSLNDEELKIIELAGTNGKTLDELVEVTGMGKYRTYENICNLMEVELIETVTFEKKAEKGGGKPAFDFGKILRPVGAVLGIVLFIALGVIIIGAVRIGLDMMGFSGKQPGQADEAQVLRETENIRTSLDIFLLQYSTYPSELSQLVDEKLIKMESLYDDVWALQDVEDYSYKYTVEDNGLSYTLETSMGKYTSK